LPPSRRIREGSGHARLADSSRGDQRPATFVADGEQYLTAEHFMMAGKARLFGDEEVLSQILLAPTPAEAKKLGRLISFPSRGEQCYIKFRAFWFNQGKVHIDVGH
jgi:ribA/ribD-fused uncharacterized protein